ncbi:SDR family NAD(P)-dependent oxidoreductase [Priestia koreensis]|uniref:SDR family NAD(P)-dependent oxidoreductase n=1 Tax=Priestia koreensis TaxID=284581 RepID=UPI002040489A|nr:SDR family oxidoreductase [Priestia koreensis]MCM3004148.1 SDR family oxidoreductase [Priestia koreensis]
MLENNKIIITGAASGIGREIVMQCLQEGASVIACDIDEVLLKELRNSTTQELYTYVVDVSQHDEVERFFCEIQKQHPNINSLVNNAGIYLATDIASYEPNQIDRVIDINVKGSIYFSKYFGAHLLKQKTNGVIVNMSSVSGMEGSSDAIYGASKAAILGLTKSCAMNFAPYIRVNAVAPTMVDTAMMATIPQWRKEEYWNHHLIPHPVTPEDVAETVIFLLSKKAKHYTGATFDLNNGGYLR